MFNEQPPKWDAPGVEPPENKKVAGYQPQEKPPADWFNWIFNRIYKVLQELQAHKHTGATGDADKLDGTSLTNGAANDIVIGNRTVDDTATPNTGPNTITNLFSYFGKMFRLITGEASWITAPAMTIKAIVTALGSLAALLTTAKTSLVEAINWLFNNTPKQTTANITLYVSTTGNDANDGLTVGMPVRNVQTAINRIPQVKNHTVTINIADGNYAEDLLISGSMGGFDFSIIGNQATPGNVKVNSIKAERVMRIQVAGVEFTTTSRNAIYAYAIVSAYIHNILIQGASGGFVGIEAQQSNVILTDSTISNRARGVSASYGSMVHSGNNSGSANVTALYAESGAVISKGGTQPTGTTAEATATGGVIR